MAVFAAVIASSTAAVLVRAAVSFHFLQLEIVSAGQTLFVSIPLLMMVNHFLFHSPLIGSLDLSDWRFDMSSILILVIVGFNGFNALSLNVIGFQYGDATKVAWFEYLVIIFAFLFQVFLFHDPIDQFEVIGCVLVAIGCSLSILEELYVYYGGASSDRSAV